MSICVKALTRFALIFAGAIALAACGSSLASLPSLPAAASGEYLVESGDTLRIAVQDLDSATAEYTVDQSGEISLPMIKEVMVRGKSYRDIENAIEAAYLQAGILTTPVVNVQPVKLRPFYVLGEVNGPGEFEYRQGMTVLAAISAAGGYTYRAAQGEVAVTRTVNGKEVTARADESTPIFPGDRIRVYERWF
jgi:polysaccharide export outer membrane protein